MSDVSAIPAPELTPPANDDALTPPTFDVLALSPETRACLDKMGYLQPTPVQRAVFEPASRGKDLVVQARTGTGKTTAFGLPIVEHLVRRSQAAVQTLVLCPTRELALQVAAEIERLGEGRQVKTTAIYGGASMTKQIEAINDGAQVVVGTPGRVLDHIKRGTFKPGTVRALVLDEADEMLSMGFERELTAIIDSLPKDRQTLLFSATLPPDIERMAREKLRQPEFITLSSDAVGALSISHFVYFVLEDKLGALIKVLEVENPESAIIFCNMKVDTEVVTAALRRNGYDADWLNGDLPQNEREEVVSRIRNGTLRFLVATDVAARGIDISHLTHVINYDFPESTESYVHRTGRTGRAGRTGTAISLVAPQSIGSLYFLRLAYNIRPFERFIPTSSELKTRREADLITHIIGSFASQKARPEDLRLARRLLSHDQAEQVIALLLRDRIGTQPEIEEAAGAARRARNPLPPREPPRHVEAEGDRGPRPFDRGDRGDRGGRGGFDRGDRGDRGGRGGSRGGSRGGFDRGDRGDRPSFERGGEPRQALERGGEPRQALERGGEPRQALDRGEPRQALDRGGDRPGSDRGDERPGSDRGGERPAVEAGGERPVIERQALERPVVERPAVERSERGERPTFERGERGGERPAFERGGRDRGAERGARAAEPSFEPSEGATGPESEQVTTPHGNTVPVGSDEAPREAFGSEARPREAFGGEGRSRNRRDRDSRPGRSDRPARGERESRDEGLPSFTVADAAPAAGAPVVPAGLPFEPPHHPDLTAEIEAPVEPATASEPASDAAPGEVRAPRGGHPSREGREGSEAPRERRRRGSNRGEGAGRPGREQDDMPVRFTVSDAEPVTTERPRPAGLSRPVEPSRSAPAERATIERPSDLVNWHPAEEEGDDRPIFHGNNDRHAQPAPAPSSSGGGGGEGEEVDDQDFAVVFVDVGRREGVRPSDLQRALRDVAGIGRRDTGRIRVRDRHSLVAVRRDLLAQAIERLTGTEIAGRAVRAEQARERTIEGD